MSSYDPHGQPYKFCVETRHWQENWLSKLHFAHQTEVEIWHALKTGVDPAQHTWYQRRKGSTPTPTPIAILSALSWVTLINRHGTEQWSKILSGSGTDVVHCLINWYSKQVKIRGPPHHIHLLQFVICDPLLKFSIGLEIIEVAKHADLFAVMNPVTCSTVFTENHHKHVTNSR